MTVVVSTEHHFYKTLKGEIYSATHGRQYSFWKRYLSSFDKVYVLARVKEITQIDERLERADGEDVEFYPLPDFIGLAQGLKLLPELQRKMSKIAQQKQAFILRVPGVVGSLFYRELKKSDKSFAVEVVGDPADVFNRRTAGFLASMFIRPIMVNMLAHQCREAFGAAYVTKEFLQKKYPTKSNINAYYSDVEIPENIFNKDTVFSYTPPDLRQPIRLIFVGTLARLYKGQDVLLKAFSECVKEKPDIELVIIGDGSYREYLKTLAKDFNIDKKVRFLGLLPHEEVLEQMSKADLFVLPSITEGLPRAMIEAMACGIPCIGSSVGGIPELLPDSDLVEPGSVESLKKKIMEVVSNSKRMQVMSQQNLATAKEYKPEVLRTRRGQFYKDICKALESKNMSTASTKKP